MKSVVLDDNFAQQPKAVNSVDSTPFDRLFHTKKCSRLIGQQHLLSIVFVNVMLANVIFASDILLNISWCI